jgi:hypothetical protein
MEDISFWHYLGHIACGCFSMPAGSSSFPSNFINITAGLWQNRAPPVSEMDWLDCLNTLQ